MSESNEVIELLKSISKRLENIDNRLSNMEYDTSSTRSNTDDISYIRKSVNEINDEVKKQ